MNSNSTIVPSVPRSFTLYNSDSGLGEHVVLYLHLLHDAFQVVLILLQPVVLLLLLLLIIPLELFLNSHAIRLLL